MPFAEGWLGDGTVCLVERISGIEQMVFQLGGHVVDLVRVNKSLAAAILDAEIISARISTTTVTSKTARRNAAKRSFRSSSPSMWQRSVTLHGAMEAAGRSGGRGPA